MELPALTYFRTCRVRNTVNMGYERTTHYPWQANVTSVRVYSLSNLPVYLQNNTCRQRA